MTRSSATLTHRGAFLASLLLSPACASESPATDGTSSTTDPTTTQADNESSTTAIPPSTDTCPAPGACETTDASFSSGPAPTCDDGIHNGAETDIDCGGDCPNTCGLGQGCASNDDCQPAACDPDTLECVAPTACGDLGNWRHLLPDDHQRASPQEHHAGPPAIAIDADGRYTVAWTSGSKNTFGVYLQQYEPTGDALGETFQVSGPSHFVTQPPRNRSQRSWRTRRRIPRRRLQR